MSLFVAGAIFGEVLVSLFVAGAVFGEVVTFRGRRSIWYSVTFRGMQHLVKKFECKIGRETLYFTIKNARGELENKLGCEAGCGPSVSRSDHGHGRIVLGSYSRVMLGSAPHWK